MALKQNTEWLTGVLKKALIGRKITEVFKIDGEGLRIACVKGDKYSEDYVELEINFSSYKRGDFKIHFS